ncbi:MAG: hypothetical protein OEW45_16435 [Deltaproteobacteria bacterium]|nr:hypothetical protein [Deltaproteobacteria bacterium]
MNIKSQLWQGIGNSDYIADSNFWNIVIPSLYKKRFPGPPWLLFLHPTTLHSKIILNIGDYGFLALTDRYNRWQRFKTSCHPTFYISPPFLQVFLEAESVVVAGPEVVSAVAVSEPGIVSAVAAPGPEVVFAVAVSGPGVVSVAVVSIADVAEPRASVDIAVAFAVLVPVSGVVVEVDSSGRPKFLAFPSVADFASSSSSDEVGGEESVHSSTGARTNDGLCSILSNLGLHQNRTLGLYHNNPTPGHNNVSDTSDLSTDATTNHRRKKGLLLSQGQRRHTYPVSLSPLVVREI